MAEINPNTRRPHSRTPMRQRIYFHCRRFTAVCMTTVLNQHVSIILFSLLTSTSTNLFTSLLFSQETDPRQSAFISSVEKIALLTGIWGILFYIFGVLAEDLITTARALNESEALEHQQPTPIADMILRLLEARPKVFPHACFLVVSMIVAAILLCLECLSLYGAPSTTLEITPKMKHPSFLHVSSLNLSNSETQSVHAMLY